MAAQGRRITAAAIALVAAGAALGCGNNDSARHIKDAPCTQGGTATLTVTGPAAYACHDPFRATFQITNTGCETLSVSSVTVAATVTSSTGNCSAPAMSTYNTTVTAVPPASTVTVLDLTGGMFCCLTMACPANFTCDESYTYTANTSAGTLTQTGMPVQLNLQSCNQICP